MQRVSFSKDKLLIIVLILLVVYSVYMLVLQPIIAWAFLPPIELRGTELYTNGTYLLFEDGKAFRRAIDSMPFIDGCEIKEFYYYNAFLRDNPFYGKVCDTFALDLQTNENYMEIKEEVVGLSKHYNQIGNYVLYLLSDPNTTTNWIIVGMNDSRAIVRCIMMTDMNKSDYLDSFHRALIMQTALEWK